MFIQIFTEFHNLFKSQEKFLCGEEKERKKEKTREDVYIYNVDEQMILSEWREYVKRKLFILSIYKY